MWEFLQDSGFVLVLVLAVMVIFVSIVWYKTYRAYRGQTTNTVPEATGERIRPSSNVTDKCPKCGKRFHETDVFCVDCGARLRPAKPDKPGTKKGKG